MDEKRERTQADKQSRNNSLTLTDPSGAISSPARSCDLRAAPDPPSKTPTRPQLLLNSAVLDRLGALAIYLRSEKRWFKIPIHSDRVDDERGCDACARAMVSICSIPNDLSGDNKLERLWENRLR
jgi:hypothetical protein